MAATPARSLVGGWETAAQSYWNDEFFETFQRFAYRYGAESQAPYPFYEIRRDHVLTWLRERPIGRLLDVGCGGGHVMEAARGLGWSAAGCDFAPRMVGFAKQRLAAADWGDAKVALHAATNLSSYADASFDAVLCLGPIEYLDAAEATRAYNEMWRLLRPGGALLCAHINQLFDLFTIDAFTADRLDDLLSTTFALSARERSDLKAALHARLGSFRPKGSIRTRVATRADNPLTIESALRARGFALNDLMFYRFYKAPPAIGRKLGWAESDAIDIEHRLCRGWPGHLLASSFLTLSEKSEDE